MNKFPELKTLPTQEEIEQLKQRNAELMAQVEQLKHYIVAITHADETGYVDDIGFVENFSEIRDEVAAIVTEHDREVAARAVEDAVSAVNKYALVPGTTLVCLFQLQKYANKIKSGEVKFARGEIPEVLIRDGNIIPV